jgi:hypothetical protein
MAETITSSIINPGSERTTMISEALNSRLSSKITKSMIDVEKSYLKNPSDYIFEVSLFNLGSRDLTG